MSGKEILGKVRTILIIDWPSKDVPEALTLAGFQVVVKGGPGPTDYERYELDNGKPVSSNLGQPPDGADLVYSFRPVEELAEVISLPKLCTPTQSGSNQECRSVGRTTRRVAGSPRSNWIPREVWC